VHRLDRFTTGVLLVAKTDAAHQDLALQFSSRKVGKTYLALVEGRLRAASYRETDCARPGKSGAYDGRRNTGRHAVTDWKALEHYAGSLSSKFVSAPDGRIRFARTWPRSGIRLRRPVVWREGVAVESYFCMRTGWDFAVPRPGDGNGRISVDPGFSGMAFRNDEFLK